MRYKKRKTANGSSDAGSSKKKPRQGQYVLLNPNRQLSDDSDSGASNQLVKLYEDDSNNASDEKNEWSSSSVDSSDYSFHESDCESVISEEFSRNVWSDSSIDSDYNPGIEDVEDIIVSAGDAILHDADDLNDLFSNDEAQIIELEEESIISSSDESGNSCPKLVEPIKASKHNDALPNLPINYIEDDKIMPMFYVSNSELSQLAIFYNCLDRKSVVLKLSGTIFFNGILKIKPLFNSLELNGYTLSIGEEITISSIMNFDYFLNMSFVDLKNSKNELYEILNQLRTHLNERDILQIKNSFNIEKDVLVYLEAGQISRSVELLQTYASMPLSLQKNHFSISELVLSTNFFVENASNRNLVYQKNPQWDNVELTAVSKIITIGGKNVGKSSLITYLINKNINKFPKILLIDLDPGQPICSLPETVSATIIEAPLLGKGCLSEKLRSPIKCFVYGEKNVALAPFKYVHCISNLIQFCYGNLELQKIPWIINSMGYQRRMGFELIAKIIKTIRPTDIIQIQHSIKGFNFQEIITEELVKSFKFVLFNDMFEQSYFTTHVMDSVVNRTLDTTWNSNASYKRKLILLCHLANLLNTSCTYLNDVVPFCHPLSKIIIHVTDRQIDCENKELDSELLNGNIVYLCDNSFDISNCFGLGIVRAIDRVNDQIFMLIPSQLEDCLEKITVLKIINICLPSELFIKQPNCMSNCISAPYTMRN